MKLVRDEEVIGIQIPAESAARALDRHPKFKVVRELEPMRRRESRFKRTGELTVCVLDVETTGKDRRTDRITELALQRVMIDAFGRIVETGRPISWLEDPGISIPEEVVKITGITDAMVAGHRINDGEAYGLISSADVVVAHNASFDRPFVERRLEMVGQPWICSLNDIDWAEHGFGSRQLSDLLFRCGWFFNDAHRATADVNALLHLLDHRLDTGGTVMRELLRRAAGTSWEIDAVGAPFEHKERLRDRGYRWDGERRVWCRVLWDGSVEAEREWLGENVYTARNCSIVREVTWRERHGLTG